MEKRFEKGEPGGSSDKKPKIRFDAVLRSIETQQEKELTEPLLPQSQEKKSEFVKVLSGEIENIEAVTLNTLSLH